MNRNHSVVFEIVPKYCLSDSLVDYEGYSISSKEFLCTVVDKMVIWVKFIHSRPLEFILIYMSMFTLAISYLTTSNLPWFMDITFQIPMQHCSYSIGLYFHHQSHPQLGLVFALAQPLHSFLSYFSTDLHWPGEFIFQCYIFLPFHTLHELLKAKILKWFAIPFSSEPRFVITLHHHLSILDSLKGHGS